MTTTAPLLNPSNPQYLDRYELIAELAAGGMATVYLARLAGPAGFQRMVAIKHLHPHLQREHEFVQMFLDEARLAARIHHPHVVPILEVGEHVQSGHYLVMEYIEGDTLARLLARGATSSEAHMPSPIAIRIMIDALDGLHAAHELTDDFGQPVQLVHRDVSPQNILVGIDGISRITDFGVARAATRLTSTRAGQLKGKLAYMAPEQVVRGVVDRRADVFAAGVVLWEVLSRRRLFKGENDGETLNRVLYGAVPLLRSLSNEIPEAVDAVVQRALERDADKRYQTCLEFADALEEATASHGALASPREVTAHMQRVLGHEIAAHRDKVRSWLSRSELSRHGSAPPRGDSRAPVAVSSLSAAAMALSANSASHVTPAAQQASSAQAAPKKTRLGLWILLAAVVGAASMAVGIVVLREPAVPSAALGHRPDEQAVPVQQEPSQAEPSAAPAQPIAEVPELEADAAVEPLPATPSSAAATAAGVADPARGRAAPVKPTQPARPEAETDDLTTNPYR